MNQDNTWSEFIWGESWKEGERWEGLLPNLIKRVNILKRVSKFTSMEKMKILIDGLFNARLRYAMPCYMNIWLPETYREQDRHYQRMTKKDVERLQVLQNQLARLLLGQSRAPKDGVYLNVSTKDLMRDSGMLLVHQMGVMSIITLIRKVLRTGKPLLCPGNGIAASCEGPRITLYKHMQ